MRIDENWTYKELVGHIKEIREKYDHICASFKYFETHERVLFKTEIKRRIYAYPFAECRRNNLWAYMQHRLPYSVLKGGIK